MKDDAVIFELLLNDIKKGVSEGNYLCALALALTIPDICGKAKYPKCKINSFRYIAWYDSEISAKEKPMMAGCPNPCTEENKYLEQISPDYINCNKYKQRKGYNIPLFPCANCKRNTVKNYYGYLIYKLRCDFLHSGNPGLIDDRFFEEIKTDSEKGHYIPRFSLILDGNTSYADQISTQVSIPMLCNKLVNAGEKYYMENEEKFNFFRYSIIRKDERQHRYDLIARDVL